MSYLEVTVTRFYEKHDPSKLGDASHVMNILNWTRNNGLDALDSKLKGKYGETLTKFTRDDDPPVESDWKNVQKAIEKFYNKHEPDKSAAQVAETFQWTMRKGVFALNDKLNKKYGEGLPKKALESWKSRWAPVVEETKATNYAELLNAFFAIHDPAKPKADIEFLVSYATRHGLDPVNEQLRVNFGVGLEDVSARVTSGASTTPPLAVAVASLGEKALTPMDPLTSRGRKEDLELQLKQFYARFDPTKLQPANREAFNKIVDYGLTRGLRKLNQALREKYSDDLDTMRRNTVRASVREFLAANDPGGVSGTTEEEAVEFAMENGMKVLDEKLKMEYGVGVAGGGTW